MVLFFFIGSYNLIRSTGHETANPSPLLLSPHKSIYSLLTITKTRQKKKVPDSPSHLYLLELSNPSPREEKAKKKKGCWTKR